MEGGTEVRPRSTLTGINSRFLHRHASRFSEGIYNNYKHKNPVSVEHSRLLRLRMRTERLLMAAQARTSSDRCCGGSTPFLRV